MAAKRDDAVSVREPFSVDGGTLCANTDLYWNHLEEFEAACADALAAPGGEVEIDLADVNFISSSFLGSLNSLLLQAGRMKKRVVLKVSQDVSWLFEIMGSRRNLDMRVV
jgi:anti-anti-sigma regulatory factor